MLHTQLSLFWTRRNNNKQFGTVEHFPGDNFLFLLPCPLIYSSDTLFSGAMFFFRQEMIQRTSFWIFVHCYFQLICSTACFLFSWIHVAPPSFLASTSPDQCEVSEQLPPLPASWQAAYKFFESVLSLIVNGLGHSDISFPCDHNEEIWLRFYYFLQSHVYWSDEELLTFFFCISMNMALVIIKPHAFLWKKFGTFLSAGYMPFFALLACGNHAKKR